MKKEISFNYSLYVTENRGDATGLIQEAIQNVYIIGGDGTINEVLNGYVVGEGYEKNVILCPLSSGTGSDLCKSLNINDSTVDSLLYGAEYRVSDFDIGKAEYLDEKGEKKERYFMNIASCGISAEICERVEQSWLSGSWNYWLQTVIQNCLSASNNSIKMILDETKEINLNAYLVAVGNGKYFGGGMKVCPNASLQDGLFHVTVMENVRLHHLIQLAYNIKFGSHINLDYVHVFSCKSLRLESDCKVNFEIDGEVVGSCPVVFSVQPNRVKMASFL